MGIRESGRRRARRCASVCNGAKQMTGDDLVADPARVGSGRAAGPRTACPSRRRRVPRRDLGDRGVVRRRSVRPGDRAGVRAVSRRPMGSALAARASCRGPTSASPTPTSSAPRCRGCSLVRARGDVVEIGCLGGHGRTGSALACLAVLTGVPADGAVDWVRAHYCPDAVETDEQRAFVEKFSPRVLSRRPRPPGSPSAS